MLDWVIETRRGDFECNLQPYEWEEAKKEIQRSVIEFYATHNESPSTIISINGYDSNSGELLQQVSRDEISNLEEEIEEKVSQWRRKSKSESEGYREARTMRI